MYLPRPYGCPPRMPFRPGVPFDQYMCDKQMYPFICEGEEILSKALLTRNAQIAPSALEQGSLSSLVSQAKSALDTIITSEALPSARIIEFREVGSFKKGTMLAKRNVADMVLAFDTLPTHETVKTLGNKVVEIIKQKQDEEVYGVIPRPYGCDIAGTQAVLRLLITIPHDLRAKLDPKLHLDADVMAKNMVALRHAVWFDDHSGQPAIKVLVRLLKDIKSRTAGFAALNVWTIELLSHYCVTYTPTRCPLPLPHAFRRFFQLLAAGFLLHTSVAVADPCDPSRRINYDLSPEEADTICRTAQFLCRLIIHEKFDRLLGLQNPHKDTAIENEVDPNTPLNIAPLEPTFNPELLVNQPPAQFSSNVTAL